MVVGAGEDGGLLFGAVVDAPSVVVEVHELVVMPAQRDAVVDVGGSLVFPGLGVVDVQYAAAACRPGALVVVAVQGKTPVHLSKSV